MAREIPTFRSERVSAVPSMGIVQQTGAREVASALQERGQLYDQIGEWANKKADEFMERDQRLAAEKAVRSGGLNPKDLSSPITKADRIYREAALNTYAIGVEDDIKSSLQRFYSESEYNPEGFRKKAASYMKGVAGGLAPELKNGVLKMALADMRTMSFKLEQQLKSKIKQESIDAENQRISELQADIINADTVEERQVGIAKMMATIESSPFLLTDDARAAKQLQVMQSLERTEAHNDLMNGLITIEEAQQRLENVGVPITVAEQQQLYNSYNVKRNFELQKLNQESAARQQQAKATKEAAFEAIYNAQNEQEVMEVIEKTSTALASAGEYEDAMSIRSTLYKAYTGQIIEAPETELYISGLIDRGQGDQALQMISTMEEKNQITRKTKTRLLNRVMTEQAAPLQNEIIKSTLDQIMVDYAPMANAARTEQELALMGEEEKRRISEDKRFMHSLKNRVIELSEEKSLDEVANIIKQTAMQTREPRDSFEGHPLTARSFESVLGLQSLAGTPLEKYESVFNNEPWSRKNYKTRIEAMKEKLNLDSPTLDDEALTKRYSEIQELENKFEALWNE